MNNTSKQDPPGDANVLECSAPAPEKKQWQAGTLTYTRRGLTLLFVWLLGGDFAWQFRDRALGKIMPLMLRKFGASDFVAGLLLGTLPAALGIVLAPTISYRSDRHRGRFGRRIPFLLIPTPIAFLAMLLLAFSPPVARRAGPYLDVVGGRFVSLVEHLPTWIPWIHRLDHATLTPTASTLIVIGVGWIVFELAAITCNSVHGALINDVVPRPLVGQFFGYFRVVSLGAGILFEFFLLGRVESHFSAMFIGLGLLYFLAFSLMCLTVREGAYPPPPPPLPRHTFGPLGAAIETYVRDCFTKPYYLWVFGSFMLANIAFSPINLFSLYFAQSVGMSMATYGKFSALQYVCSLVQAPILGWLCDKFHSIRMTIFALCVYATVTLLAFFFVRGWTSFAVAHVVCGTCSGIWLTTTAPLGQAILPKMKFATFASAMGVCTAVGSMITAPLVGRFLDFVNRNHPAVRDYHYIYLWASCFITCSLLVTLVVYQKFKSYGGPGNYIAPE